MSDSITAPAGPTEPQTQEAAESNTVSNTASSAVSSVVPNSVPSVVSPAVTKFKSCRWRRPPEDGPECCGHRDVLPIAGTSGFDPEAWCPDCSFYKLRRTPKKRSPEDYRY